MVMILCASGCLLLLVRGSSSPLYKPFRLDRSFRISCSFLFSSIWCLFRLQIISVVACKGVAKLNLTWSNSFLISVLQILSEGEKGIKTRCHILTWIYSMHLFYVSILSIYSMYLFYASYAIEDETKCAQTQPDVTYEHESIHVRMIWHAWYGENMC